MKRKKNVTVKALSLLLSLVMAISLLPVTAAATAESDEASKEVRQGGMVLTKSVALQADGTYTIDLSAYATGSTSTTTSNTPVPLDIVLVLDQSGSMAQDDDGDWTDDSSEQRQTKVRSAVTEFVTTISEKAETNHVDHKIGLVGFASDVNDGQISSHTGVGVSSGSSTSEFVNTGVFIDGYLKNYGETTTYVEVPTVDEKVYELNQNNNYYINIGGTWYTVGYSTRNHVIHS